MQVAIYDENAITNHALVHVYLYIPSPGIQFAFLMHTRPNLYGYICYLCTNILYFF